MAQKDFSKIVEDHNYFSDVQEDSVCKATSSDGCGRRATLYFNYIRGGKGERTIRIRGCSARSIKNNIRASSFL